MVTEWVKWQQHFLGTMQEQPPRPDNKVTEPQAPPNIKENLDYETHSDLSPALRHKKQPSPARIAL